MAFTLTDNYTALPIEYSEEDSEWLISHTRSEFRTYLRCDCHDAYWHYSEIHYVDTDNGELLTCDAPFVDWPDHS